MSRGTSSRASSVLRRVTGLGGAGTLALAFLAGGCVLAATAGPRQAQATETRALWQTLAGLPAVDKTIVVSTSWTSINGAIEQATGVLADRTLSSTEIDDLTAQLRRDFSGGQLPLTPRSTDWMGMTPALSDVPAALPSLGGIPAQLEIAYRYPVAGHLRLVAGSMPDTAPPPTSDSTQEIYDLQVVVTPQTAKRFALRPGSQLAVGGPLGVLTAGKLTVIRLNVTGIVEPADPGSAFWQADPLLPAPTLSLVGGTPVWQGGVIADPGELAMVQQIFGFGQGGLRFQWELPADARRVGSQAGALGSQLNQITGRTPALTGPLAPVANALSVSSGLVQPLAAFVQTANDLDVLLLIVYVGLAVAGVVTLLLTARMIAVTRSGELTLRRARGASLRQLFWSATRGAAVASVPAAALAWAIAVLLVPGAAPPGPAAWWPGLATLACAAAGPGIAAAWPLRPPRRRQGPWRRRRWLPRVVIEVTACAAAIGGIIVFRSQAGATGLFASAAPVLIAVPAVIVALRLYQVLLRGLARVSARQRGIIGFLGLTRAAAAPVALTLPAMTLVLALTVAAFTGMVRNAVVRGEIAASWQSTGADVVVTAPAQLDITPATMRAIAAVPGVREAASALVVPLTINAGDQVVTAVVVNPATYAKLVGDTETFPPFIASWLTQPLGHGVTPALASPTAAAELDGRAATIAQEGLSALRIQVVGQVQSTPALPGGGAFIVLPSTALRGAGPGAVRGPGAVPAANLMLLTGPSIDMTRLRAAIRATAGDGAATPAVITRSAALQELTGAPLQQGTFLLFTLAIAYAAALALGVMLLELALGAADREVTTGRLATMGLTEGQRVRLLALETVPPIAAAAVAAAACAFVLPRLVGPEINLSVFTQSAAAVPLGSDFASFLLPLAGLVAITVIALAYEVRSRRGRGVAVTMRT